MELGISSAEFSTYSIIGVLFSICVIFPPQEFNSAGFTISKIFDSYLGNERIHFVLYHMKRISLTIFIHGSLPLIYFIILELLVQERVFSFNPTTVVQYLALLSILLSIAVATFVFFLSTRNWELHHVTRNLKKFSLNWKRLASTIDSQMRAPVLFIIRYNSYSRVIVTTEWLIRVSNYNVVFAKISESKFRVVHSDKHPYLSTESNGIQMVDVCVESINNTYNSFFIRVHSQEMLDTLSEQLGQPISISESLILPQPLHDRFVDSFLQTIEENPRFVFSNKEDLEPCLGCSTITANVKLDKNCVDSPFQDQSEEFCRFCNCRPMWCARCMGRIFASKQNQDTPEVWMSGRASCPTCRANFCVLDVSYVE